MTNLSAKQSTIALFFQWYLYEYPVLIYKKGHANLLRQIDRFSLPIHLKTLFVPWKRYTLSTKNAPFSERMGIFVFNILGRFIGFFMRIIVILIGLIAMLLVFLAYLFFVVAWVLAPVVGVLSIIYGLSNL